MAKLLVKVSDGTGTVPQKLGYREFGMHQGHMYFGATEDGNTPVRLAEYSDVAGGGKLKGITFGPGTGFTYTATSDGGTTRYKTVIDANDHGCGDSQDIIVQFTEIDGSLYRGAGVDYTVSSSGQITIWSDDSSYVGRIIVSGAVSPNATATWGSITGSIATQTDLIEYLNQYAFNENGTYEGVTVGNATNANHATTADNATNLTSTLPITKGGTGKTTATAAMAALIHGTTISNNIGDREQIVTSSSTGSTAYRYDMSEVADYIKNKIDLLSLYPVGSIYINYNNTTSPASFIGGSWARMYNYFLMAGGSTYDVGQTGGSSTVKLTTSNMPSHSHSIYMYLKNSSSGVNMSRDYGPNAGGDHFCGQINGESKFTNPFNTSMSKSGSGTAHENMPPYISVVM